MRIKKEKLLPEKDKYKVRGILMGLADLGIMPNLYMKPIYKEFTPTCVRDKIRTTQPLRSDVILPLAGWKGGLGIDEKRLKEVFGYIL